MSHVRAVGASHFSHGGYDQQPFILCRLYQRMITFSDPSVADPVLSRRQRNQVLLVGAIAAGMSGFGVGVLTLNNRPDAKPTAAPTAATATAANYRRIPGDYQPLNEPQIAAAFTEGQRIYAGEGLSGLANASIKCFERLGREPTYGLMDYCLALDVYGAKAYATAAGDEAPSSTWFGQGPVRRLAAVQALTAGVTDANARMLDTNRAIETIIVATKFAPAAAQAAANVPAHSPAPSTIVVASIAPAPTLPPPPFAAAARAAVKGPPPRLDAIPAPTRKVEASRSFRGPSFDCRGSRSVTQQMICSQPELAAADRSLAAAFDQAMTNAPNPVALRRQQDRWLAARERAGDDYDAVLDLYKIRARELRDEF